MRFESKLCHISDDKAVVQVIGWINDKNIGSSLAEASTVELAEDKAITRLIKRLDNIDINRIKTNLESDNKTNNIDIGKTLNNNSLESQHSNQEPNDWSNELTAIDSEIERLNWSREDEISFIKKTFGYNNRAKITKYNEIINYLNLLKNIDKNNSSLFNIDKINNMIEESDKILRELSWDNKKGQEYLIKEFNVSTRKELNHIDLISFVSKLKTIRNNYLTKQ